MSYCTPTKFWQTKMPSAVRPEDFEPGEVSPVTHTGTGTGTMVVVRAYPKDAYTFSARITVQGELGAAKFVFTLDGTTWSYEQLVPADGAFAAFGFGALRLADVGIGLLFAAGTPPSFRVSDTYSLTTTASPAILGHIQEVEDELDEVLSDDLVLPLLGDIGKSIPGKVGILAA